MAHNASGTNYNGIKRARKACPNVGGHWSDTGFLSITRLGAQEEEPSKANLH